MHIIQTRFVPRSIVQLLDGFLIVNQSFDHGWMAERLSRLIANVEVEVQGQRQDCVWPTLYSRQRKADRYIPGVIWIRGCKLCAIVNWMFYKLNIPIHLTQKKND